MRFLDAFVEQLDLKELGFQHASPAETGRPLLDEAKNIIRANHRFAARRRDHEAVWKPSGSIAKAIREAALDDPKYAHIRSVPERSA